MLDAGQLCIKTAGREAGKVCIIVKRIDENFVMVTGPRELTRVKRRKCNILHLEPLEENLKIASDAPDSDVLKAYQASSVMKKYNLRLPTPQEQKQWEEQKAEKEKAKKERAEKEKKEQEALEKKQKEEKARKEAEKKKLEEEVKRRADKKVKEAKAKPEAKKGADEKKPEVKGLEKERPKETPAVKDKEKK